MTLEDMEKRLRAMEERIQATEDIEAIKQLHYRYMNGFTQAKWDEALDCFAEDCTLDVVPSGENVVKGKAEIEKAYGMLASRHKGTEGDLVIHPIISVNGDKAKGKWLMYMMYPISGDDQHIILIQGIYNAEYVKVNGQWKFSFLQHRPRIIEPQPSLP